MTSVTVLSSGESVGECNGERTGNSADQPVLSNQTHEQSDVCCGKNGICSHEVLRDGDTDSNFDVVQNKVMRKVLSFASTEKQRYWLITVHCFLTLHVLIIIRNKALLISW